MEINKIYCKLGNYEVKNENGETIKTNENVIVGYFICFAKSPKYRAMGCNFDESKDFENAVVIQADLLDKIHVGYSQVINGVFVENKPQEM